MKHHHNIDELREALADKRGRIALSRRGFLQGAGVMAAGAAAAGMIAGCSPQTEGSSNASDPCGGEAMATTGSTAAATGNEGKTMGEVLGAGWLGEEPEIAEDEIASVQEADIIVCGAGHAGTATARRARAGAKVIVVEMQPEDTFQRARQRHRPSELFLAARSSRHSGVFGCDFMNKYQMPAPAVCSRRCSPSSPIAPARPDWFIDGALRPRDELIPSTGPLSGVQLQEGPFTSYVGTCQFGGSAGMTDAVKRSQEKAKAAGAQFVYGQAAVRLVHNEDGTEVTGVIAKDSNSGEYTQYNGRAVVLACGDIGSNSAMYNAICRENYELGEYKDCSAMSGRDGSGIAMAMRIGAKVEIASGGDMGSHAFIPLSPMEGVECLWLNKYGERYCNEAFGGPLLSGCAGAREPGDRAYLVWGNDWQEVFLNQLAGHLAPKEWDADAIANVKSYMDAAVGSAPRATTPRQIPLLRRHLGGVVRLHGYGRGREGQHPRRYREVERRP
ncbi:MAG: FAD-binding protein [Adlercreutzia equolifaciens]